MDTTAARTRDDVTPNATGNIIHYIDPIAPNEVEYDTRHKASRNALAEAITEDAFAGLDGHLPLTPTRNDLPRALVQICQCLLGGLRPPVIGLCGLRAEGA